jgi:hypothetical protein
MSSKSLELIGKSVFTAGEPCIFVFCSGDESRSIPDTDDMDGEVVRCLPSLFDPALRGQDVNGAMGDAVGVIAALWVDLSDKTGDPTLSTETEFGESAS